MDSPEVGVADVVPADDGTAVEVLCGSTAAEVGVAGAGLLAAAFRLNANLVFGAAAVRSASSCPSSSFNCYT